MKPLDALGHPVVSRFIVYRWNAFQKDK